MYYDSDRLLKVWTSVAYNDDRYWAFMRADGAWRHTDSELSTERTFPTFGHFERAVRRLDARDIHVKRIVDGGREWVIDVDHHDADPEKIALKNAIAHLTFQTFFAHNCERVMFSGNRGVHVWLSADEFSRDADKAARTRYYDRILERPASINRVLVRPGSLDRCFLDSLADPWVQREMVRLYPHISPADTGRVLKEFFPCVDKQVFVSTKQIRAPYSYNTKGRGYSREHELCGRGD